MNYDIAEHFHVDVAIPCMLARKSRIMFCQYWLPFFGKLAVGTVSAFTNLR